MDLWLQVHLSGITCELHSLFGSLCYPSAIRLKGLRRGTGTEVQYCTWAADG